MARKKKQAGDNSSDKSVGKPVGKKEGNVPNVPVEDRHRPTVEWTDVVKRLKYHRERLGMTKEEAVCLIRWWYDKTFNQLTNVEVIEFGVRLSKLVTPPPPF